ncbi:MAG: hypothetical protein D6776_07475 [Planctomycetota bacterium]|nr:MAG: hypothetical protein D6776_07475 [Planctomycetota bacterium]
MAELRTFTYLDVLQPQFTAFVASTARGYLPVAEQASLWVEIAPGMAIQRVTDVALKRTDVRPAVQVVERAFGVLEVHSFDQGEVREAGRAILEFLGLEEKDRIKPSIKTGTMITNVDPYQAMLINRMRRGSMLIAGQTLYILEVYPAAYASIAANEAEKAAPVNIVHVQPIGAFGRVYLGGTEAAITEAARAVEDALAAIDGREG